MMYNKTERGLQGLGDGSNQWQPKIKFLLPRQLEKCKSNVKNIKK